jgi:hypothetical protein
VVVEARVTERGEVVGQGFTGPDGGFEMAVPGAGTYRLTAAAPGGFTGEITAVAGAGHAVVVLGKKVTPREEKP